MGYYINPRNESKESFLQREGIALPLFPKTAWASIPKGFLPVGLVNNGAFTAAGIAYCESDLEEFTRLDDNRHRQLFMVKIEKLIPVAGSDFKEYARKQGWIPPIPPRRPSGERIHLEMTMDEVVEEMAKEGAFSSVNAVVILTELLMYGRMIDVDDAFEGFGTIMGLDSLGIHGDKISAFYEMCDRNIVKMIAVSRAHQLGQLAGVTREKLLHAIANDGEGIDVDAAVSSVKERLPRFNTEFRLPNKQDKGSVILA